MGSGSVPSPCVPGPSVRRHCRHYVAAPGPAAILDQAVVFPPAFRFHPSALPSCGQRRQPKGEVTARALAAATGSSGGGFWVVLVLGSQGSGHSHPFMHGAVLCCVSISRLLY